MTHKTRAIGQADFHILLALFDRQQHGYGIMNEVSTITNGGMTLGPGTLYGAIKRLLRAGLIAESKNSPSASRDDSRRTCYYRITRSGRKAVAEECARIADLMKVAEAKGALAVDL